MFIQMNPSDSERTVRTESMDWRGAVEELAQQRERETVDGSRFATSNGERDGLEWAATKRPPGLQEQTGPSATRRSIGRPLFAQLM